MHGSLDFPHYTLHFSFFPFHVSSHMLLLLCMHAHSSVNLVLKHYTYKHQGIQIVVEMSRKKREMFGFTQRCGILFLCADDFYTHSPHNINILITKKVVTLLYMLYICIYVYIMYAYSKKDSLTSPRKTNIKIQTY